jgi:hypothetical protein
LMYLLVLGHLKQMETLWRWSRREYGEFKMQTFFYWKLD